MTLNRLVCPHSLACEDVGIVSSQCLAFKVTRERPLSHVIVLQGDVAVS